MMTNSKVSFVAWDTIEFKILNWQFFYDDIDKLIEILLDYKLQTTNT